MANQQHLDIIYRGVRNWNTWREAHSSEGPDLSGANLEKLNLIEVNLRMTYGEDLYGGFPIEADLTRANLAGANLTRSDLTGANLTGASLTDAKISSANFSNANLSETFFCRVDLRGVNLTGAKLTRVSLNSSNLTNIDLSGTDLDYADLSEAKLSDANLSNTWISNTNMRAINLTRANLTGAKLIRASLREANLTGANLTSASLGNAFLSNTNLTDANLSDAELVETNFSGACLNGANLAGAHMKLTIFANIDLRNVKGLETVNHHGPSTIGTDTLSRSGGDIPEMFLRKAGVRDNLITYTVSLANKPIKYYNCVISYANQDQDFAERLYNGLQQKGVRCWYAPEGMTTGPARTRVGESFHIYDKLLWIVSQHSIHTRWAKLAVEETLFEEGNKKIQILFPIRLDNTILEEEPRWISVRHLPLLTPNRDIADFTGWKLQNSFQEAVNRFVPTLQSSTPLS